MMPTFGDGVPSRRVGILSRSFTWCIWIHLISSDLGRIHSRCGKALFLSYE